MKKQTKKTPRKNTSRPKSILGIKNAKTIKFRLLQHLRLIEHRHTGKLVHPKHTSHVTLVVILVITGFFIYINNEIVRASQQIASNSVGVSLLVPGAPPTAGAIITSPDDGDKFKDNPIIQLNGTCAPETFVVVYKNTQLAGSATCTVAGLFEVEITLSAGENALTALNFDNLNQPGPVMPTVTVTYTTSEPVVSIIEPVLPINPVIIPGVPSEIKKCSDYNLSSGGTNMSNQSVVSICSEPPTPETCDDYKLTRDLPTGGEPHVQVVCTSRFANVNEKKKIGVLAWGGLPPYALSLNWGEDSGSGTLLSIQKPAYIVAETSYAVLGVYTVRALLTDANIKTAVATTNFEVNGEALPPTNFIEYVSSSLRQSWFETPVPMYLTAVGITLGFWGGDLFNRYLGAKKYVRKVRT